MEYKEGNLPFELYFEWKEIRAFSYGKPCLKTSNNFSDFDKIILTIIAGSKGSINFFQHQLFENGKKLTNKDNIPVNVFNGDKVEFTVTRVFHEGDDKNLDGYFVKVYSEAEIKNVIIECIKNNNAQVKIETPVKFLHEENYLQQMIKVCHYCLKEECTCGGKQWVYVKIPILKLY